MVAMADKWLLEGSLFDACNCLTLCPCNYFQSPTQSDCKAAAVWHIEKGNLGSTNLNGLNVAGLIYSKGNPFMGIEKASWIMEEKATPAQREALTKIFSGQVGGIWGMMAKLVKTSDISYAKLDYGNDGKTWWAKSGGTLDVKGGFVKAPPQSGIESSPKKAQTYDALYSPTMEKTVGISDHYKANLPGMNYDITGRYSSSGRFTYQGP